MENRERRFRKVLNAGDVLVTAFGAMIGWGWVVSSGGWIAEAGVLGTVLGFLIGGLMIYFVGLVYAELTTAIPASGGPMLFSREAFGPAASYACNWSIILSYVGVVCFEACSLPTILQYVFPGFLKGYLYSVAGFDIYLSWLITAIASAVAITAINMRGIKAAAILQKTLTIAIAIVGILLTAASAVNGDAENLRDNFFNAAGMSSSLRNMLAIAVVAPFFLFGFDVIPQVAEEINVPLKKLGSLLVGSIALAVAFYGLIVIAVGYGMSPAEIQGSMSASGLVPADAMAKLFGSPAMAKVLIMSGLCGIVTSWNSFLIGGSRALCSMAEFHMLPKAFSRVHPRHRTPTFAILMIGVLSVASVFCGRVMLVWISNCASFACCLAYCIVALSFLRLRKKSPQLERPFRVKHPRAVGTLAAALSAMLCILYLLPKSSSALSPQELAIVAGWILLGVVLAILSRHRYGRKFGAPEAGNF